MCNQYTQVPIASAKYIINYYIIILYKVCTVNIGIVVLLVVRPQRCSVYRREAVAIGSAVTALMLWPMQETNYKASCLNATEVSMAIGTSDEPGDGGMCLPSSSYLPMHQLPNG